MSKRARHWSFWFALTLGALIGVAIWAALRVPTFRGPALDFYAMKQGEYFNAMGLTRRQGGGLKLGFAETQAPPPIGAFGNHIINYFGADAFDRPERAEYFFNYSYANLSLPEILLLLRHIETRGRLPRQLVIVQITPPNADNGGYIIDHGNELPSDIMLGDLMKTGSAPRVSDVADALWETVEIRLHEVVNYNTLILGSLQNKHATRFTGPAECASAKARPAPPAWFWRLPWTMRAALDPGATADLCATATWVGTFRRDGSVVPPPHDDLIRDADPLHEADRKLRAGDEVEIARTLRAIDAVGRRNGAAVVFLIPPVFESDRQGTVVNQIMDRALARASELTVIDDRAKRDDPKLFSSYLHPSAAYFHQVAAELRARGLLDRQMGAAPVATTHSR